MEEPAQERGLDRGESSEGLEGIPSERRYNERVSIARSIVSRLLRPGGFLSTFIDYVARGSGCCCGVALMMVLILILGWYVGGPIISPYIPPFLRFLIPLPGS